MDLFYLLDNARKAYVKSLITVIALAALIVISCILMMTTSALYIGNQKGNIAFLFIIPYLDLIGIVILCILYFTVVKKAHRSYRSHYKAYFIKPALEQIFTDLYYNHETGISKGLIDLAGTINTGDRVTSNDYITGKYKDVDFAQSDIKIEEKHENGEDRTYYATIFKGRYMIFDFPKEFNFKLLISQKFFRGRRRSLTNQPKRKLTRISTESDSFNKKFNIYAEDGFEAYYLLGPDLLDRIENLSNNIKGKILLCFNNNKLHIAIQNNKDAFEPPNPFRRINKEIEIHKVRQDIKAITDFIDQLKLDSKLFKN